MTYSIFQLSTWLEEDCRNPVTNCHDANGEMIISGMPSSFLNSSLRFCFYARDFPLQSSVLASESRFQKTMMNHSFLRNFQIDPDPRKSSKKNSYNSTASKLRFSWCYSIPRESSATAKRLTTGNGLARSENPKFHRKFHD